MDPNTSASYGNSTLGYGKLTKDQSDEVDANKRKIDKAKEVVSTSIANVAGVKAGSPMLQSRVNQFVPSVSEGLKKLASQDKLTDAQKELLGNAKTNVKEIEKKAKDIHEELNILAKKAAKAESEMSAKYEKLDESSQKVESFKGKRDFGQANPLLGTKKIDRVEESYKREMEATGKASVASVDAKVLIGKQDNLSTQIADLGVKKATFSTQLEVRFNLAKDIHTKIKDAEKEYEDLGIKYEARKEAFFNYKDPAKMKDEAADDVFDTTKIKDEAADDVFDTTKIKDEAADDVFDTTKIKDETKIGQRKDEKLANNSDAVVFGGKAAMEAKKKYNQAPQKHKIRIEDLTYSQMKNGLKLLQFELENARGLKIEDKKVEISKLEAIISKREKENELFYDNAGTEMSESEAYHYEINIARELQGENVIKMHTVIDLQSGGKVMIQEAAGFKFGKDKKQVIDLRAISDIGLERHLTHEEEVKALEIVLDGLRGVERMHDLGYIHRDLKEDNFLVTKDGRGVLSDFGTVVKEDMDPLKIILSGTPCYCAPEAIALSSTEQWNNLTKACDVWSVGIMLFGLFSDFDVFNHPSLKDIKNPSPAKTIVSHQQLYRNSEKYEQSYPEPINNPLEHLIWSCTRVDPLQRPTMKQVNEQLEAIIQSTGYAS